MCRHGWSRLKKMPPAPSYNQEQLAELLAVVISNSLVILIMMIYLLTL